MSRECLPACCFRVKRSRGEPKGAGSGGRAKESRGRKPEAGGETKRAGGGSRKRGASQREPGAEAGSGGRDDANRATGETGLTCGTCTPPLPRKTSNGATRGGAETW